MCRLLCSFVAGSWLNLAWSPDECVALLAPSHSPLNAHLWRRHPANGLDVERPLALICGVHCDTTLPGLHPKFCWLLVRRRGLLLRWGEVF